jgi:hypothetical protein
MPCNNKFQNELSLELIDYEPAVLIVGTFEPEWPAGGGADWFYGRTANNFFWDVLPRLYGEASLINATPREWRDFCSDNKIAITNLMSGIDDADAANKEHVKLFTGLADQGIAYNFDDFEFVNIVAILKHHPSIKNVYLTRGITEAFWRHVWNPVIQYCSRNGIYERRLPTPSPGEVAYQHGVYNDEHPDSPILLTEDYILMRWKEEWHY